MTITSDSKFWVRALSVTAIAAAGLLLSGCSLLGSVSDLTGGDTPNTDAGTDDNPFKLVPGDCFDYDDSTTEVESVDVVDCETPHEYEAYASIIMTGDEYPGDDATSKQGDEDCSDPFTAYVGLNYDESKYTYVFFSPTQASWESPTLQDREILCIAVDDEEGAKITGSVKGANE